MIRINLLPRASKQAGRQLNNQIWAGGYLGAVLVLCGGLAFLYLQLDSEAQEIARQNQVIQQQIADVKAQVGNLDQVKAALERSKQLEKVVGDLLRARSGPARMLMELSNVLTPGEGPTIDANKLAQLRRVNPEAGFTVGWDTRRLWLRSFEEQGGSCSIAGVGKNNEDVAEFLRRLEVSELFDEVALRATQAEQGKEGLALISFDLGCKVSY